MEGNFGEEDGRDERRQGEEVKGDRAGAAVGFRALQAALGFPRHVWSNCPWRVCPIAVVSIRPFQRVTARLFHNSVRCYLLHSGQHAGIFQRLCDGLSQQIGQPGCLLLRQALKGAATDKQADQRTNPNHRSHDVTS